MASPTTPTHGLYGNIYVYRENGFKGIGLNDLTWGLAFSGAASAHYEVVIDAGTSSASSSSSSVSSSSQSSSSSSVSSSSSASSWSSSSRSSQSSSESSSSSSVSSSSSLSSSSSSSSSVSSSSSSSSSQSPADPNTFKWRKNGGAWTTGVAITGAEQTLDDNQKLTFNATTGHSLDDQWSIGNFKDEACTENDDEAQVTALTKRILNPNSPPTFTDDGGKAVLQVDYSSGWAKFTGTVNNVDIDGNNGYLLLSGLERVAYFRGFTLNIGLDAADVSKCGQKWKEFLAGQCSGTGTIEKMFIANITLFEQILAQTDGSVKYFFLQLFTNDPDFDQSGDHFNLWVIFNSLGINTVLTDAVLENIGFQVHGHVSFTADA